MYLQLHIKDLINCKLRLCSIIMVNFIEFIYAYKCLKMYNKILYINVHKCIALYIHPMYINVFNV